MMTKRPQWWQLYMLGAMIVGLLLLAHFTFADVAARHIAQIGIVLIGYRLILAWVEAQARAIEHEDWARLKAATRDHDVPITEQ